MSPKRETKKEQAARLEDWALLGSAIGNILQAFNAASLEKDLNKVRESLRSVSHHRDYLVARLRDWQLAYRRMERSAKSLQASMDCLREEAQAYEQKLARNEQQMYKIRSKLAAREERIKRLEAECEELRKGKESQA